MEIITGYTGENHVTSADDASLYRGILGRDDYVLDVGNKFAATIIDNNTVRIMDGDLVIQGHQARIRANDYEEVTIDNGTPGEKRNDLIVARYQKNTTTGIESITLEVVKGTPGETATDPEIIQEDLTIGDTQRDYPLYRVSLNGLVLESVTSLFTVLPNLADYASFKGIAGQWIRIDNLSAPVEIHTGGTENQIYVPLNESMILNDIKVYAVEFMIADRRNTNISIFTTPTNSGGGIIVGAYTGEILTASRGLDSGNPNRLRFYGLSSSTYTCYVSKVFRLKDGELQ